MMKVLAGYFTTESNTNSNKICRINDYDLAFDELCIDKCHIKEVFNQ